VDNCSRWPAVYLLKTLTVKAVCDALLDLFVNVGVPQVITSDKGSNFTSQLTTELLRLGCSPTFNTPGHPEASGMVKRFKQTCKNMLSHVVREHKRQWHKVVPLMVWALREVPYIHACLWAFVQQNESALQRKPLKQKRRCSKIPGSNTTTTIRPVIIWWKPNDDRPPKRKSHYNS